MFARFYYLRFPKKFGVFHLLVWLLVLYNVDENPIQMSQKEKFYNTYNNIPLNLRDEVVWVVNGEPISWKILRVEVESDTQLGKDVLNKLEQLGII